MLRRSPGDPNSPGWPALRARLRRWRADGNTPNVRLQGPPTRSRRNPFRRDPNARIRRPTLLGCRNWPVRRTTACILPPGSARPRYVAARDPDMSIPASRSGRQRQLDPVKGKAIAPQHDDQACGVVLPLAPELDRIDRQFVEIGLSGQSMDIPKRMGVASIRLQDVIGLRGSFQGKGEQTTGTQQSGNGVERPQPGLRHR